MMKVDVVDRSKTFLHIAPRLTGFKNVCYGKRHSNTTSIRPNSSLQCYMVIIAQLTLCLFYFLNIQKNTKTFKTFGQYDSHIIRTGDGTSKIKLNDTSSHTLRYVRYDASINSLSYFITSPKRRWATPPFVLHRMFEMVEHYTFSDTWDGTSSPKCSSSMIPLFSCMSAATLNYDYA